MDNENLNGKVKSARTAELAKPQRPKDKNKRKLIVSLVVMIVGLIALVVGVVFLVLGLARKAEVPDGEYLISATEWTLEDGSNCANAESDANCTGGSGVIWKFTEAGKGSLTTNNHKNDYDFIWALEDGNTLKIETKWLYDLDNTYEYRLDKSAGRLTLADGEKEFVFSGKFTEQQ